MLVNSISDLFHGRADTAFIARVWAVMAQTPEHTYQVLTKRPERLARVLATVRESLQPDVWPLPNVWLAGFRWCFAIGRLVPPSRSGRWNEQRMRAGFAWS
jgi:protein gp37